MMGSRLAKPAFFVALVCLSAISLLSQDARNSDTRNNNDEEAKHYSEQGQKALAEGRFSDAEQAFEKLRGLSPGVAEVHAQLGVIYFQERKFDQAVASLRQAQKLKPGLPRVQTLLAVCLSEAGRYQEALPGLEKGFRSSDDATRRMCGLQLERAYTGLRLDRKAVEVALEMDRLYPNDPEVLYHDGKIYGNFAFLTMQHLAEAAPNSIWRHQAEAEAYESQGSYDRALSEYKEVLAENPRRPGIHYRIGRVLLARSRQTHAPADSAAAEAEFQWELQLQPDNANAAYEIAEIHHQAGELEQAQRYFEMALKYYPDFEQAHLGLAATLYSLHKPELALPELQQAIQLDPKDEVAWYRLSQVQRLLGNTAGQQKAVAEFQRLRSEAASRQADENLFSPTEVTKQQVDSSASQ